MPIFSLHPALALIVSLATHPLAAAPSPLAGARLTVLPNGLRLIHREQHSAPLVAIDVWVRAGSGREAPNESGAAHFLEHLLFKGTPTRKPGEIDAAIEDLGATLSAGTTRDGAHFYTTVSSEHAGAALEVIADALRNATLDPVEMEKERAVILDELARSYNDGRKQSLSALYGALFPEGPMGRPVLGLPESIKRISRETVYGFYRRWYLPNNATAAIVGDITPDEADKLVAKHLGDWKKGELPAEPPHVAVEARFSQSDRKGQKEQVFNCLGGRGGALSAEEGAVAQAQVAGPRGKSWLTLGTKTITAVDGQTWAVGEVVSRLLADGSFGRIPDSIRAAAEQPSPPVNRRPTAALVAPSPPSLRTLEVEFDPHRDGCVLTFSSLADRSDLEAGLKPVEGAFLALQKEPATNAELDYARRRAVGAHLFAVETYAGQARALGEADIWGDYRMAVELSDRISKVKAEDVTEFARRWFEPARLKRVMVQAGASR